MNESDWNAFDERKHAVDAPGRGGEEKSAVFIDDTED